MSRIDKILKIGVSLKPIGVKNWALSKENALAVLEKFYELKMPILGGDVCEIDKGIINYNYDNWYCEKRKDEGHNEFVVRSIQEAEDYINNYKSDDIDKIFFVFVASEY
jgi:hypothetical protein